MNEMVSASNIIYEEAGEDVNVIFGCVTDKNLDETQEIHVTVVATGINNGEIIREPSPVYNGHNQTTNYFDNKSQSEDNHISDDLDTSDKESFKLEDKQLSIDSDSNQDNKESTNLIFGEDDLEVPAFLRNGSN